MSLVYQLDLIFTIFPKLVVYHSSGVHINFVMLSFLIYDKNLKE